jgi:hypothetical protein
MKRNAIIILAVCTLSVVGVMLLLYWQSPLSRDIRRQNFERKFIDDPLVTANGVVDLKYNSFYIAGITEERIWFGNSTAPFLLVEMNKTLTDSQHVELRVKRDEKIDPLGFRLRVDSPFFFLMNGSVPAIIKGRLGEWEEEHAIRKEGFYFEEAVPLGSSSFACRSYSKVNDGFELGKSQADSFRFQYSLLERQVDAVFSVDGRLDYDKGTNQLVYVYYYRNEFIVADTDLNLRYRGHTIDTFSIAKVKVAKIGSKGERMLAAPPFHTNALSSVFGGYLYVKSNLLAKNEDFRKFKEGSVIDVYDLTGGSYCHSFHIANYRNYKLRDFRVWGDSLVALFDHFAIVYRTSQL